MKINHYGIPRLFELVQPINMSTEDFVDLPAKVHKVDLFFPVILNEELIMDGRPTIVHDLHDGTHRILLVALCGIDLP